VAQRRKEIGIRIALGAKRRQVLGLVLREGAALVGVGTLFGLLSAIALSKLLSAMTSVVVTSMQIGVGDLRLVVGAPVLLALVTFVACYIPARRAATIDPLVALRQ
jgi:ABC-type antimicrobial peptide transport system permease subunit